MIRQINQRARTAGLALAVVLGGVVPYLGATSTAQAAACLTDTYEASGVGGGGLVCTAGDLNDAVVASVTDGNGHPLTECVQGETINFSMGLEITATGATRYDLTTYIEPDGNGALTGNTCTAQGLIDGSSAGVANLDSDPVNNCADIPGGSGTNTVSIGTFPTTCNANDAGKLVVSACFSWGNNQTKTNGSCQAFPGTVSKCKCDDEFELPVTVKGKLIVKKQTVPTSVARDFNFSVSGSGVSESFMLSNGEAEELIIPISAGGIAYSVAETAVAGFGTTVQCTGGAQTPGTSSSVTLSYTNPTATCTFINTQQVNPKLKLTKIVANGGPASATDWTLSATKTTWEGISGAGGAMGMVNPGTYTLAESTGPVNYTAGPWICDGHATVGSVMLGYGDDVHCTITNTYVPPPVVDLEGCTPGYWKQRHHFDSWINASGQTISQHKTVGSVFSYAPEPYASMTLAKALRLRGGKIKALLRHAVAAYLNSVNPDVDYKYAPWQVVSKTNQALRTKNYERYKDMFADANEAGCPLN